MRHLPSKARRFEPHQRRPFKPERFGQQMLRESPRHFAATVASRLAFLDVHIADAHVAFNEATIAGLVLVDTAQHQRGGTTDASEQA